MSNSKYQINVNFQIPLKNLQFDIRFHFLAFELCYLTLADV